MARYRTSTDHLSIRRTVSIGRQTDISLKEYAKEKDISYSLLVDRILAKWADALQAKLRTPR